MIGRSALAMLVLLLAGPAAAQLPTVKLAVPIIKQPYNLCLPASVSMVLSYWGVQITPETIGDRVPVYKDGTTGAGMVPVVERLGFHGFLVTPTLEQLMQHLQKGRPPVVVLSSELGRRHAMVLVGADPALNVVWLNDPASGQVIRLDVATFTKRWTAEGRWTLLVVPK